MNTTTQHLIQKCIAGDREAQYELYKKHADRMLNVANRIVKNREDARDILQDSYVKAFKNLKGFKYNSSFETWLKRIVINTAINFIKKKGINIVGNLENVAGWYPNDDYDDQPQTDHSYTLKIARQALMQLPTGYRTVISLYLIEGYDHEEIASILGISKSTSLTQYKRGKEKLQTIIQKMKQNA